jgi:7-carboxy-7-deazaguanine synthase
MTTLPIAETFHSIQGEGTYTGTPMKFIRLAGCNVGQHPEHVAWEINQDRAFPILKTGQVAARCHTYDNRGFWCDTDFWKGTPMDTDALLDTTWERHVCITGGEPLLHGDKLEEFSVECQARGIMLHIESSGTISRLIGGWLTISPKLGFHEDMIDWADEIKLLVDPGFRLDQVPECIMQHQCVYVQPINDELTINMANFQLCMEVLRVRPDWKLSIQQHKQLGLR